MNKTERQYSDAAEAMNGRGDPAPIFTSLDEFNPELSESLTAIAYWKTLPRAPGKAPQRANCDLLDLAGLLPTCFVIDLVDETNWPVVMFGTELVDRFGLDATGLNGYEIFDVSERDLVAKRLHKMCEHHAIMYTVTRLPNAFGVTIDTEWVYLPLADESGKVVRILTSIARFDRPTSHCEFEMTGTLEKRRLLKLVYATD